MRHDVQGSGEQPAVVNPRPRSVWKSVYRVCRSVLFTLLALVVTLYAALYVALQVPPVQRLVKGVAEEQLSQLLGGKVSIGSLSVMLWNEVSLRDVSLESPSGERCLRASRIGGGIDVWRLISDRRVVITYVELVDFDVDLWKRSPRSPLNIDFIIKALSPKDRSKPPAKFDLEIHHVVLRRGGFTFSKLWLPRSGAADRIDLNHIRVSDLRGDIDIPRLRNDDFRIDLRRLAFKASGLDVQRISGLFLISPRRIEVRSLAVELPGTLIRPADLKLDFNGFANIGRALESGTHRLRLDDNRITPSDFAALFPPLRDFSTPLWLSLDLSGNLHSLDLPRFSLKGEGLDLSLSALLSDPADPARLKVSGAQLALAADPSLFLGRLKPHASIPSSVEALIGALGSTRLKADLSLSMPAHAGEWDIDLACGAGRITTAGVAGFGRRGCVDLNLDAASQDLDAGAILAVLMPGSPLAGRIGSVAFQVEADGSIAGGSADGMVQLEIPFLDLDGHRINAIAMQGERRGEQLAASLSVADPQVSGNVEASARLAGSGSEWHLNADILNLPSWLTRLKGRLAGYDLSGRLSADLRGDSPDNITGSVLGSDLLASCPGGTGLACGNLELRSLLSGGNDGGEPDDEGHDHTLHPLHEVTLDCDYASVGVSGHFTPSRLLPMVRHALGRAVPNLFPPAEGGANAGSGVARIHLKHDNTLAEFFNLPVRLLRPVDINAAFNSDSLSLSLDTSIPYLQQGRDKLLRNTALRASLNGSGEFASVTFASTIPTKKGDLALDLDLTSNRRDMLLTAGFNRGLGKLFEGSLEVGARMGEPSLSGERSMLFHVFPSTFMLNGAEWRLGESDISFADRTLSISDFSLRHDKQFILIQGRASADPDDRILLSLADIDLSYIFDTLAINYVTFGGSATGEIEASELFTSRPVAATRRLTVRNLSYNGALLGDGELRSRWNHHARMVELGAHITEQGHTVCDMDGGIWVTRDSLALDFNTDHVNVAFLQPFMGAFCSQFGGRASGRAKLYGTFSDIDLRGRLKADSVAMKIDYTNVTYFASDSVIIDPGRINIPALRIRDRFGNSGVMSGYLSHRFFHDPVFRFSLTNASHLLCYDTNPASNPVWYGRVFASGNASVSGRPGHVGIMADVLTERGSDFTFVLSDTREAESYDFLTFTDRRREEQEVLMRREEISADRSIEEEFRRRVSAAQDNPSVFDMDLRVQVNPNAKLTLVMDPVAGDKITAWGSGPMNITYTTDGDEMRMYGKYTLERGSYNFSLQDLILKDFTIRPGSSISFNGDPYHAMLDITAAYRVNTNLTDLDKSFASDRELNRTNVPADALLKVSGELQHPDIGFDIDLPTLTEETARKVRSIISTSDMMSRQVIYLLALNRFYTPEYMGGQSNGGEWASVASSTLSSQLQNVLSQLTDKLTLAPSLRSDKGDFSDVEVDVALSSRLLNNRLLINGNFGYRDRSTSNTTFVGDFDIEYLLSRNGQLRLKAYNHFNDQNYYLKSALTTQGIGIIYRKDFDNPFTFLRRKRKRTPSDSLP